MLFPSILRTSSVFPLSYTTRCFTQCFEVGTGHECGTFHECIADFKNGPWRLSTILYSIQEKCPISFVSDLTILVPVHLEASVWNRHVGPEHNVKAGTGGGIGWRRCVPTECTNQRRLFVWTIIQLDRNRKRDYLYNIQSEKPSVQWVGKVFSPL